MVNQLVLFGVFGAIEDVSTVSSDIQKVNMD
jgi:hypothetical protein